MSEIDPLVKEMYRSPVGVKTRSKSQEKNFEKDEDNMTITPRGRAKSEGTPRGRGAKSSSNPGDIRTRPNAHTEVPSGQRLSQQGPPLADVQPTEPQGQETQEHLLNYITKTMANIKISITEGRNGQDVDLRSLNGIASPLTSLHLPDCNWLLLGSTRHCKPMQQPL